MASTVRTNINIRCSITDDFDEILRMCQDTQTTLTELSEINENTQQPSEIKPPISPNKPKVPRKPSTEIRSNKSKEKHIISELITTEEDYIEKLAYVIANYEQWLNENVGVQKTRRMFKNLTEILLNSQSFLQDLKMNMSNGCEVVAEQFTKNAALFQKYMSYCRNQQSAEVAYTEARDKIKEREIALDDKLGLHTSLLRPVQRLAKYEMLLKELQRLQDENGAKPRLAAALVVIRDVSQKSDNLINLEHLLKPEKFKEKLQSCLQAAPNRRN